MCASSWLPLISKPAELGASRSARKVEKRLFWVSVGASSRKSADSDRSGEPAWKF